MCPTLIRIQIHVNITTTNEDEKFKSIVSACKGLIVSKRNNDITLAISNYDSIRFDKQKASQISGLSIYEKRKIQELLA